jgi:integrase
VASRTAIEAAKRTQLAKGEVGIQDRPRYTIDELLDRLKVRYQLDDKASVQNLSLLKKAKADFGAKMSDDLTTQDCERYKLRRRKADYANASTNRIFQILRRAYVLAGLTPPALELLPEDNTRQGFFAPAQMEDVLTNLPDDGLRDFVRFCWSTGMRKGEASALRWSFVQGESIIVPAGFCKNKKPHRIPIAGPLSAILERRENALLQSDGRHATFRIHLSPRRR